MKNIVRQLLLKSVGVIQISQEGPRFCPTIMPQKIQRGGRVELGDLIGKIVSQL